MKCILKNIEDLSKKINNGVGPTTIEQYAHAIEALSRAYINLQHVKSEG